MTFRTRLTLLFVVIVLVPIVGFVAVLEIVGVSPSRGNGRSDARLMVAQRAATALYEDATSRAAASLGALASDRAFARALQRGDTGAASARANALLGARGLTRIAVVRTGGGAIVSAGDPAAVAPAQRNLTSAAGAPVGVLEASVTTAPRYAASVRRLTGADAVVRAGNRTLATTLPAARTVGLPQAGRPQDVEIGGDAYRAAAFTAPGFLRSRVHVTVLEPRGGHPRLLIAIILGSAVLLVVLCALYISRVFQFERQAEELERQAEEARDRESQLRRVGQAFASGLDREALLRTVVEAAVDGVGAQGGRVSARALPGAPLIERMRAGDLDGLEAALAIAEEQALSGGTAAVTVDGVHALADPLRGSPGELETVAVGRRTPFTDAEREVFGYLTAQAGVAIENVGLHESVQAQAITDELTGLANHRRFQETIDAEAERARRFGQPLSLVMLDIDDFKAVNDTYGHQQGDVVLAEVARVLRASSRDIDSPARYGGEEFALILPQTDLDGAYRLAERVRSGIEALRIAPGGDPGADPLEVTASLGVSALSDGATGPRDLLARADAALYEAKRTGKNKTVRSG